MVLANNETLPLLVKMLPITSVAFAEEPVDIPMLIAWLQTFYGLLGEKLLSCGRVPEDLRAAPDSRSPLSEALRGSGFCHKGQLRSEEPSGPTRTVARLSVQWSGMRSVWAILGAFLITSLLFRAADFTMLRLFPSKFDDQGVAHDMGVLVFALCYAVAFYVLGGFLAAAFAPRAKLKHALAYGVLVLAIGVAATAARLRCCTEVVLYREPRKRSARSGPRGTITRVEMSPELQFTR